MCGCAKIKKKEERINKYIVRFLHETSSAKLYETTMKGNTYIVKVALPHRVDTYEKEIKALNKFARSTHPNVVTLIEHFQYNGRECMVLEDCGKLTLMEFINNHFNKAKIPQNEIVKCLLQIANGIKFIHSFNIVHLDLKTDNILFSQGENPALKIIDFGEAAEEDITSTVASHVSFGSFNPPESLLPRKSTDIYRFSVILYEMATTTLPDFSISYDARVRELEEYFLKRFYEACSNPNWRIRPSIEEIIFVLHHTTETYYSADMNAYVQQCNRDHSDEQNSDMVLCHQNLFKDSIELECSHCNNKISKHIFYKLCRSCNYVLCEKHIKFSNLHKYCPLHGGELMPVVLHMMHLHGYQCSTCSSQLKPHFIYYICAKCSYSVCFKCHRTTDYPKKCIIHNKDLEKIKMEKLLFTELKSAITCTSCKDYSESIDSCHGNMRCAHCIYNLCSTCYAKPSNTKCMLPSSSRFKKVKTAKNEPEIFMSALS